MVESLSQNPADLERDADTNNKELVLKQCEALIGLLRSGLDNDTDLSEGDRKVAEKTIASLEKQKERVGGRNNELENSAN